MKQILDEIDYFGQIPDGIGIPELRQHLKDGRLTGYINIKQGVVTLTTSNQTLDFTSWADYINKNSSGIVMLLCYPVDKSASLSVTYVNGDSSVGSTTVKYSASSLASPSLTPLPAVWDVSPLTVSQNLKVKMRASSSVAVKYQAILFRYWLNLNTPAIFITRAAYTAESGLPVWEGDIEGTLAASSIPNIANVVSVDIGESVDAVGASAFSGCSHLTGVIMADSVESIGVSAFSSCSELTGLIIPEFITSIQDSVFRDCVSFQRITLPDGVESIEDFAFAGCSELTSVSMPDSVTSLGNAVFYGCGTLQNINISESVNSINEYTFSGCSSLANIDIPGGVTDIGDGAFSYCFSLSGVEIPGNISSIGSFAFQDCRSISGLTIPVSIESIGMLAFYGCSSVVDAVFKGRTLQQIRNIEDGTGNIRYPWGLVESRIIPEVVEDVVLYTASTSPDTWSDAAPILDTGPGFCILQGFNGKVDAVKVIVPSIADGYTISEIGSEAFAGCSELAHIVMPDGVRTIGDRAFADCGTLTGVTMPSGAYMIDSGAFYNCSSLMSVIIPDSMSSIGQEAFMDCSGLRRVVFMGDAPSVGGQSFYNVHPDCTAYVHRDSVGWDVEIPGTWQGIAIDYYEDD